MTEKQHERIVKAVFLSPFNCTEANQADGSEVHEQMSASPDNTTTADTDAYQLQIPSYVPCRQGVE